MLIKQFRFCFWKLEIPHCFSSTAVLQVLCWSVKYNPNKKKTKCCSKCIGLFLSFANHCIMYVEFFWRMSDKKNVEIRQKMFWQISSCALISSLWVILQLKQDVYIHQIKRQIHLLFPLCEGKSDLTSPVLGQLDVQGFFFSLLKSTKREKNNWQNKIQSGLRTTKSS